MSVRTHHSEADRPARRARSADQGKTAAAQRAYARRGRRTEGRSSAGAVLAARDRSTTAGRIPFVVAIMVMIGCGLALTLLLTTRAAEASYQLGDARAVNRALADERAALRREVAAADSPPELAARARELGMIPAMDPARLLVGPDGKVTVIGEPRPAQGTPVPPLNPPPPTPRHGPTPGERLVPVTTTPPPPAPVLEEGGVVAAPPMDGEPAGEEAPATTDAVSPEDTPQPPEVPTEPGTVDPPSSDTDPASTDGASEVTPPTPPGDAPVDGVDAPASALDGNRPNTPEPFVESSTEGAAGQPSDQRAPREEVR
ncbi:hypothetical protein [Nocardia paucivorans]|uniref:hypothetical protein n=1 Tax=Nocardia paucivorans TaxID=114259 RepID=UPI000311FEBE|nr:hypothetical protein [Nocardia paucivorans]